MTERQLLLITDFRPDVIHCTPGYALTLAQEFRQRGVRPDEISLRFAIVGAEPWTEAMRDEIDARARRPLVQPLRAVGGDRPGRLVRVRRGSRTAPTSTRTTSSPRSSIPRAREPLPEGEVGVLVFTTLTKQALPRRPLLDGRSRQPVIGSVRVRAHAGQDERGSVAAPTTC